jgi:hypothetical protein
MVLWSSILKLRLQLHQDIEPLYLRCDSARTANISLPEARILKSKCVAENFWLFSLKCPPHCRRSGRSNANESAPFSMGTQMQSGVSTFRLMVVFSRLLLTTVRFVCGAYAMAHRNVYLHLRLPLFTMASLRSPSVQMGIMSLLEMKIDS